MWRARGAVNAAPRLDAKYGVGNQIPLRARAGGYRKSGELNRGTFSTILRRSQLGPVSPFQGYA